MASAIDGKWTVTEVDAGSSNANHHLSYLPSQQDSIEATFVDKPGALKLVMSVEGVTKTKLYFPLAFAATTLYYFVEELSPSLWLLDVVMIDMDHAEGKLVMHHDYYWSDQTHWTVNAENKLVKDSMSADDVITCVLARYKLGTSSGPIAMGGAVAKGGTSSATGWRGAFLEMCR